MPSEYCNEGKKLRWDGGNGVILKLGCLERSKDIYVLATMTEITEWW